MKQKRLVNRFYLHPQERIFEFINTNSVAINCQYLDLCLYYFRFFFAIFAEVIVPHPESIGSFVDYANASLPPCKDYLFGTDQMGRDVFSRVIFSSAVH